MYLIASKATGFVDLSCAFESTVDIVRAFREALKVPFRGRRDTYLE